MFILKTAIRDHLKNPLYHNAYYLILNAGGGAVLGFAFWIVVARFYSPSEVGLASALISAVTLASTIARLGMNFGLIRFLSSARDKAPAMINSSFTIGTLASLFTGLMFLAGVQYWAPDMLFVQKNLLYAAVFIVCAVIFNISVLLDTIFVALRTAKYTLIKNLIEPGIKILLIFVFVFLGAFDIIYFTCMS